MGRLGRVLCPHVLMFLAPILGSDPWQKYLVTQLASAITRTIVLRVRFVWTTKDIQSLASGVGGRTYRAESHRLRSARGSLEAESEALRLAFQDLFPLFLITSLLQAR